MTVKNTLDTKFFIAETCKFLGRPYDRPMAGIGHPPKSGANAQKNGPSPRARNTDPTPEIADPRMLTLIEAAETMFLAKGYHAATMSDVAKAAGMSKKTVYQMIESKTELFAELLAHHQTLINFPTHPPGTQAAEILAATLLALGRFLLSPEQIAIIRLIMTEYTHSPELGRLFHRNRVSKAKTKLETCLTELSQTCTNNTTFDAKEMAAILFGMAIGEFHISTLVGYRPAPTRQILEKRIRTAVDIFLAGCPK